ncbi:MAG TPA: PAS domain S-box protein, partial [Burkholderiaceae bacterium]|nr:PAS domain S-box protein [Burkholderiaceae bacterium]
MTARDPSPAESTPDWGPAAQAMYRAAQAVSRPGGPTVFAQLVRDLADILDVATAFVAVFTDTSRSELRTLAAVLDGKPMRSFDYVLEGSPCAQVVGHAYRHVAQGVSREFRPDTVFAVKGMDSYAAFPLFDSADAPLGLLVAMDRRPIADATLAEALLKIFAGRIVAEIEQLRAHEALRRSESSYRAIFESAEIAIFIHDWDTGAVLDANPKACATYGYSPDEMRRISVSEVSSGVPPYTGEQALRYIEQARQGLSPVFEWHRRNKDGSLHWDEVRLKVAHIDGKPHVLAYTHDITQRKAAEAQLRASEEQYRA